MLSNQTINSTKTEARFIRTKRNFSRILLQGTELELVSEEVQAELDRQIKQEKRTRRIIDATMVTLMIIAMAGVLIWLL